MFKRKSSSDEGGVEPPRQEPSPAGSEIQSLIKSKGRSVGSEGEVSRVGGPIPGLAPAIRPGLDVTRRVVDMSTSPRKGEHAAMPAESKKLIVGRDISLNGKIASCDRLIVEGKVEAELQDCHTIEIAESGTFKGAAEIENAEISGRYEGSLTVRDNLLIKSTGHVSGTIRYGRVAIERGGEINGDVKSLGTKTERPAQREATAALSSAGILAGIGAGGSESRSAG